MIKGLYTAVSAMITGLDRQALLTHNAANLDTPGFKQIMSTMEEFKQTGVFTAESATSPSSTLGLSLPINDQFYNVNYIGSVGTGVYTAEEQTNYTQGALLGTEQPLDLAIEGSGYFKISTPEGDRYTRDGSFNMNAKREIVTADGNYLLDKNGKKITLPEGSVIKIDTSGTIFIDDTEVTNISLYSFADEKVNLARSNDNTFEALTEPNGESVGTISQGYLEGSNVDVAHLMTQMVSVMRSYEAAQQMVSIQDDLLGRSISTLGRI